MGSAETGPVQRRVAPSNPLPALRLDRITHRFGSTRAVDDVSLEVARGEFVVFLGPSGCGKTTLLRMIGGFVTPDEGRVLIDGLDVGAVPPERRGVGIVFQSYALFPHLSVDRNIGYGLKARHVPRSRRGERVADMLRLVRMDGFGDRYPAQLSGGQQQRVALARALAIEPAILLLDEPFAALDKNLRQSMQVEMKRIQREAGITTIMVTHDQDEALSLADRIAVFDAGRLEQIGTPDEVYDEPASEFVSAFVGQTNLLPGRLVDLGPDGARIELDAGASLVLPVARPCGRLGPVKVSIRPENLRVTDGEGAFRGTVTSTLSRGTTVGYDVALERGASVQIVDMRRGARAHQPGDRVGLGIAELARCPVYVA